MDISFGFQLLLFLLWVVSLPISAIGLSELEDLSISGGGVILLVFTPIINTLISIITLFLLLMKVYRAVVTSLGSTC